jgi:hypothetical protein
MSKRFCDIILRNGWYTIENPGHGIDGETFYHVQKLLGVIVSERVELDGRRWRHVSCSHKHRIPTYEELCEVKDVFIGRERCALQVFPEESQKVNIHPNVLHLWHCLDTRPVPDFTQGTGMI